MSTSFVGDIMHIPFMTTVDPRLSDLWDEVEMTSDTSSAQAQRHNAGEHCEDSRAGP